MGDFKDMRTKYEGKAWRMIGGARGRVIAFLIENRNINNELRMTTKEISEKTGVSARTIGRILDDLEDAELVVQGIRSIMINPYWIYGGNGRDVVDIYKEFDRTMQYYGKGKYKDAVIVDDLNS